MDYVACNLTLNEKLKPLLTPKKRGEDKGRELVHLHAKGSEHARHFFGNFGADLFYYSFKGG